MTKYFLLLSFIYPCLFSCNTQEVKKEVKRKEFYPDGITKLIVIYDTIKDLERCVRFYENGKIKSDILFRNKLKQGKAQYYTDEGFPDHESTYKNDTLDGPSMFYYPNGDIRQIDTYVDGKVKTFVAYDENQQIIDSGPFVCIRTISDTVKKGETYYAKIFFNSLPYDNGEVIISINEGDLGDRGRSTDVSGNSITISIVGEKIGENKFGGRAAFLKHNNKNKDSIEYSYYVDFKRKFFVK